MRSSAMTRTVDSSKRLLLGHRHTLSPSGVLSLIMSSLDLGRDRRALVVRYEKESGWWRGGPFSVV